MTEKEVLEIKLERLDNYFPNKNRLSIKDVMGYLPCSRNTALKLFKRGERYISKVMLANKIN
ncbi:MAG: hypothetical protein WC900_10565 [Oscillospiraceae bacterium]|jgi:hypothetical protein